MLFKVVLGVSCSAVLFCWSPYATGSPTSTPTPSPTPTPTPTSTPTSKAAGQEPDRSPTTVPRKVAVLIAGEYARSSEFRYNSGFWFDTVMMYCMLRENGYADEDIYVLYGHGQDGFYYPADPVPTQTGPTPTPTPTPDQSATPSPELYYEPPFCHTSAPASGTWGKITDFPMTYSSDRDIGGNGRCRPQELFECLEKGCFAGGLKSNRYHGVNIEKLDANDFLFVWWRGHGSVDDDPETFTMSLPFGASILGTDVIKWVQAIPAASRLLVFETCRSGCMTKIIKSKDPPTVVLAAARCNEFADADYEPDVLHGVWSYWVAGTLGGFLPNDASTTIKNEEAGTEHAVHLSRGGPVAVSYSESRQATEFLEEEQHPAIADKQSMAKSMMISVEESPTPTPTPTDTPVPDPEG